MNIVTSKIGSKILRIIQNNKKLGLLSALVVLDAALLSVNSRSSEGLIGQSASLPNYHETEQQIAACPKNIAKNLAKKSSPGSKPTVGASFPSRPVSVKAAPAKPQTPVAQTRHFKKSHQIFSPNFTQSPQQVNKPEERRRPLESRYLQGAAKQAAAAKEKKALEQEVSKQEEEASKLWEEKQSYARRAVNAINFSVRKQIEEQQKTISNPGNDQTLPGKKDPQTSGEPVIQTVQDCSQDQEEEKKVLERLNKRSLTCQDLKEVGYTVNFEDISILELLQFVSKISGTNFVFDSNDLQFNVTIVSHDPTSVDDLATILLQVLKMHDLKVVEQGNNVLIYRNPKLSKLSTVVTDGSAKDTCEAVVVTRVFRLYSVSPSAAVGIIQPLLSHDAIISASESTRHIIVSDIAGNIEKVRELLQALDSPGTAIDMSEYDVQFANPAALVSYCQDVLGAMAEEEAFQIFIQPGTNKIFVISSPRLTAKTIQLLESLDIPEMAHTLDDVTSPAAALGSSGAANPKSLRFFMYKLKYQNGAAIAQAIQDIGYNLYVTTAMDGDFINTLNSIQWLPVNNSIVVIGNQANVDKVVSLLNGLDLPPKQVYIEVLILETSLEKSWDFGVQWAALGDEQGKVAYASGLLSNTGLTDPLRNQSLPVAPNPGNISLPTPGQLAGISDMMYGSSAFGLGIIGNVLSHNGKSYLTLGGLLSALDQDGDTTVVLNPRIMAQDTQQASFFVGQTIPFQTTSTVIQETGSVTQNIEYEDIGVNLVVTSTIAPNNVVTLQIEQTISELHSAQGVLTPVTDKTFAATRLQVPDGCFLVMSGHIRDKLTKIVSGVPLLSSLPLIKGLFSRSIDQRQKRNIMIFIKPKVISSFEEGTALSNTEGYRYNWESERGSLEVAPRHAPECQHIPKVQAESDFKMLEIEAE